jgi:hypothetical protein
MPAIITRSNENNSYSLEAAMETKRVILCKSIEAEMINASALMEAEILLDQENSDYFRGFLKGYAHCLKLTESLDALNRDRNQQ